MGKQKPKTSIIAQMPAKAVNSLYARISNLLDSYYVKIIFGEPSLDIRTSSFVYNYHLRKSLRMFVPKISHVQIFLKLRLQVENDKIILKT